MHKQNKSFNQNLIKIVLFLILSPSLQISFSNASQDTWELTGSMEKIRVFHEAVKLNSGKIMVMGGKTGGPEYHSLIEIYDPSTGKWSNGGSLQLTRIQFSAILLDSGKVLVSGGRSSTNIIMNQCEEYDPESGISINVGAMSSPRHGHRLVKLDNGKILAIGGKSNSTTSINTCEIYDPSAKTWSNTVGSMNTVRAGHSAIRLKNGKILVAGGSTGAGYTDTAEIFDQDTKSWSPTGKMIDNRGPNFRNPSHSMFLLENGNVIIIGGQSEGGIIKKCEMYDSENGVWSETTSLNFHRTDYGAAKTKDGKFLVAGGKGDGGFLSSCEIYDPKTDSWSVTKSLNSRRQLFPLSLLSNGNIIAVGGGGDIHQETCELFISNQAPTVSATASPTELKASESVSFTAEATDPDGDTLTFSWNFGDGTDSSEQNPAHTYSTAGTYTATVTVTDSSGNSASAEITITVSEVSDGGGDGGGGDTPTGNSPTARFTSRTVVGFVDIPIVFEGTLSTDPENNITSYSWDFGDGSPAGSDKTIAKIYSATGTYTIQLTVTDSEGLTDTASRQIEILPEEAAGTFDAYLKFKVKLNLKKENRDSIHLLANVNVGTQEVAPGTTVKVEFAGNTFTGELNTKLQDKSDKNEKWKVKANTTKQATGEVKVQLKVKKANLAAGFQEAGVTAGDNPKEEFELELPILITIGERTIETTLDSTFKFNKKATKAKGSGKLE